MKKAAFIIMTLVLVMAGPASFAYDSRMNLSPIGPGDDYVLTDEDIEMIQMLEILENLEYLEEDMVLLEDYEVIKNYEESEEGYAYE